ncbi:MAG: glycoside hydrolase family 25 protein [Chloroflexota bacterium]
MADSMIMLPKGVDVSHHQGPIDWDRVKGAGTSFAFIKATEGTGFVDSAFTRNWEEAGRVGILRGAYHYFRPSLPADKQARHFLNHIPPMVQGDIQPTLDFEETDDQPYEQVLRDARKWVDIVERALQRQVIVYTYPYFWTELMHNSEMFCNQPLWYAAYRSDMPKQLPGGWPRMSFWQFTATGSVPGIKGRVDRNMFNGTLANLRKFAGYK